ncbi:MAG: hypothetical protein ACKVQC_02380 [Elusimicrobiota bacterium]
MDTLEKSNSLSQQPLLHPSQDGQLVESVRMQLNFFLSSNRKENSSPIESRIENFLKNYLNDLNPIPKIKFPGSFVLDKPGMARILSLPSKRNSFHSDIVDSYRVGQGVLHNPKSDRRTTQGVFHITEGGLSIPEDKVAVPKEVFAALLQAALCAPKDLLKIPFTIDDSVPVESFISLMMRPLVCPKVGDFISRKSMEIRFLVPGGLVSNLDFVETIFGNAGDPYLSENDAALDIDGWTGHTGCVILAPHLIKLTKKELGLSPISKASARQKRDGMCWEKESELYNNGNAFKVTCRDRNGVMVTIIADNYFGYCKKEVKTQISYSANLFGLVEEEHAGGAIAFPSYILGIDFTPDSSIVGQSKNTFQTICKLLSRTIDIKPEGYAVDRQFSDIWYVPENAHFDVKNQSISWDNNGTASKIKLLAGITYVLPSGYKVHMERQIGGPSWRLVGTAAEGTLCHKPCTVSGGGKSEISKSIAYSMLAGPVFVRDFHHDFEEVEKIINKDFSNIFKITPLHHKNRSILSLDRSLGSVIKLLIPSDDYTDEYNQWLRSMSATVRQLVFAVKRYYRPEWGENWREHFSVDRVNGFPGHELRHDGQKLVAHYLRVGHDRDGSWRIFKVRVDFNPANKVQVEDDITASIVVPREAIQFIDPGYKNESFKLVANCESFLFQRPDDAIYRGYDKQAEADLAEPHTFLSNWQPLNKSDVKDLVDNIIDFDLYTSSMKSLLQGFIADPINDFVVSSAHPRMVNGKPSKNPRYLQKRPDQVNASNTYLASVGARLAFNAPVPEPIYFPVHAVLPGRRNNPPDHSIGLPALAVFNPIHFQELPELFMDFIASLTGKSPSTTGFGSEGALTKGPFNALWPVVDLNNALLSFILTGYSGFSSAAGHIGPHIQVDHDVSMLIPEIWCRMKVSERDPKWLLVNGLLEKCEDYDFQGKKILASRLGYRITKKFVDRFLGRLFETPHAVFPEEMLKPEVQDAQQFAEGIEEIVATQKRVAENYFQDGSVNAAIPPLKALLHIMVHGHFEGKTAQDSEVQKLFDRNVVMNSAWYKERLATKQSRDKNLFTNRIAYLEKNNVSPIFLEKAKKNLELVSTPEYLKKLIGTLGADPFHLQS